MVAGPRGARSALCSAHQLSRSQLRRSAGWPKGAASARSCSIRQAALEAAAFGRLVKACLRGAGGGTGWEGRLWCESRPAWRVSDPDHPSAGVLWLQRQPVRGQRGCSAAGLTRIYTAEGARGRGPVTHVAVAASVPVGAVQGTIGQKVADAGTTGQAWSSRVARGGNRSCGGPRCSRRGFEDLRICQTRRNLRRLPPPSPERAHRAGRVRRSEPADFPPAGPAHCARFLAPDVPRAAFPRE